MCTAITLSSHDQRHLFGRNMDFAIPLSPSVYAVPKGFRWKSLGGGAVFSTAHAFLGAGQDIGQLAVADGVNEQGLAGGALYFPGYAHYEQAPARQQNLLDLAAVEFLFYCLGHCASIEDVRRLLPSVWLVGIPDPLTGTAAPLHWMFTDRSGRSIVVERTAEKFAAYDNPVGTLANSPDFPWHLNHLRLFLGASPVQKTSAQWGDLELTPFGQGGGSVGIPGDYTPPSRFVRAAFQRTFLEQPKTAEEAVVANFHILSTVGLPKGVVKNAEGHPDYTQYTCCMDTQTATYFFSTYGNRAIQFVRLADLPAGATAPVPLAKMREQPVFYPAGA